MCLSRIKNNNSEELTSLVVSASAQRSGGLQFESPLSKNIKKLSDKNTDVLK